MRGAAEDRAGAIIHQDEVRDPDRQRPVRIERVAHADAGVHAALFGLFERLFRGADPAAFGDEGRDLGVLGLEPARERMVGRDRREGGAHQRVGARRVDLERVEPFGGVHRLEGELQPAALADPVGLHQAHLFGPAVEPVEGGEQFAREIRDAEEPLRQLAPLHHRARAPAAPLDHLLIGKHGHVDGVPVHHRRLAIDEPRRQHVEEHRLLLAVVFGVAGREFAAPVDREAERLHLALHHRDVVVGPARGVAALLHRGVLGGHAEGVPAHRVQHRIALRDLGARHHIAHRVVAHMPHVDAPRRIGEHLEHIILGPRGVAPGGEDARVLPRLLPFGFDRCGGVARHLGYFLGVLQ